MFPFIDYGDNYNLVPTLTINAAEIVTLANDDTDLPFVKSALKLLLPKVKVTAVEDKSLWAPLNPMAVPTVRGGLEGALKVYEANSLSVAELRALEALGAIVALYSFTIGATNQYTSLKPDPNGLTVWATLDLNILQAHGTFQVRVEYADNVLKRTFRTFPRTSRIAVNYHDAQKRYDLMGLPFKKPEKPKVERKSTAKPKLKLVGT